ATGEQHDAVQRIGADGFFHIHAGKVAEKHGGGAHDRLPEGSHGKLQRKSSGFDDTPFDDLCEVSQVTVAWSKFRPCVAYPNHRLAPEVVVGVALITHP